MFVRSVIVTACAMLAGSGCSSSPVAPTPPAGPPAPVTTAPPAGPPTVTISATGFSPLEITVPVAARVTFVNADRIGRDVASGLDHNSRDCPEVDVVRHEECPPVNRVGLLAPGQQRDSSIFEAVRYCGFHDHLDPTGVAGRIEVRIE